MIRSSLASLVVLASTSSWACGGHATAAAEIAPSADASEDGNGAHFEGQLSCGSATCNAESQACVVSSCPLGYDPDAPDATCAGMDCEPLGNCNANPTCDCAVQTLCDGITDPPGCSGNGGITVYCHHI